MEISSNITRRHLVKSSAAALSGLVVAFHAPLGVGRVFAQAAAKGPPPPPNAFIRIAPDNIITIVINKLEMGQGVNTSMAQLIAEELECDWQQIRSVSAPVDKVYNHTVMPLQMTGGSTSLASSWDQHRLLGASLREMLRTAAATRWGVPVEQCRAELGAVVHATHGRLTYGELAEEANKLPLPVSPTLKKPDDFKIIGKSVPRVDAADKASGRAQFALDVRLPGMLHAMVAHPPLAEARIVSVDDKAARAVPGVIDVVRFGERVAVLARNTFAARKGRDALVIAWNPSEDPKLTTASLEELFRKAPVEKAAVAEDKGGVDAALRTAATRLSAEYLLPFLAHASMEPLNVVINFDGERCEVWSGHQMPGMDQLKASQILGIPPASVTVHTTYAGGSFGRRASKTSDYVAVAAELAKVVKKPLQVTWSREDDMQAGYYRPMALHRVDVGIGKGKLVAWDHHVVCQSIMRGSPFEAFMPQNGIESAAVEGVAPSHYAMPAFRCRQSLVDTPLTTLWWRSVGHTHTAFVMETMIDELASALKKDPLALRQEMLKSSPRHLAVLKLLEKPWRERKAAPGRSFGLAIHESFNSVVGQIVEVSLEAGMPSVHRVWCAVHCGTVVNPEVARSQIESGVVFGLSAALYQQIQVEKGRVVSANFDDYQVLRMNEMPLIEVSFVPSTEPPTGLGEPGVPPIAPAVANAVFALAGKRVRVLPFSRSLKS